VPDADHMSPTQKRLLGVLMALAAGALYGVNFNPPQYLMDHASEGHSTESLDYVFSHFSGIFLTSTVYFLVYCLLKKNKPEIYPQTILPGFISGVMWAIGTI
jgi:hypothetical protein